MVLGLRDAVQEQSGVSEWASLLRPQPSPLGGGTELNRRVRPCRRMLVYYIPHRIVHLSLHGFPELFFSVSVSVDRNVPLQRTDSTGTWCNDPNANLGRRIKHLLSEIKDLNKIYVTMKTATYSYSLLYNIKRHTCSAHPPLINSCWSMKPLWSHDSCLALIPDFSQMINK